jgi:hypothetical protein
MTAYITLHDRLHYGHLDLTGLAEGYVNDLERAKKRFTNLGSGGYEEFKPGLASGSWKLDLFQDLDADVLDDELGLTVLSTDYPVSFAPNAAASDAAGDVVYLGRGRASKYTPVDGAVGDEAKAILEGAYNAPFARGVILHPKAARTATGNGSAVALAGPTSAQRLYAGLHVFAYTGLTSITVKIASDDNGSFTSATDRLTFTAVAAAGASQFASAAGGWNTETHLRVTYTIVGTGSCTFAVHCGVI